ncbi:alpha/beta hydrolase [Streptomyces sp. NBC_00663]|uniref:alpha/beta hydrolase family protein n=1 Tax=Streptomyces sp. NBC_00663 TaxID=2975801 RepID=UPI002E35BDE1|nr:alpha/beta hydrolase family protein [Streptomyces sp. NBC_00663]
MPYRWKVAPEDLFVEWYWQMVNSGLPIADVATVRSAVTDMWLDEPGGWVYEWSRLAAGYAELGQHHLAALAYGWAKFPTLADDAKRTALERQLKQYLLAAPGFKVGLERRAVQLFCGEGVIAVPVHLLTPPGWSGDAPVMLASGGVDTWKMDLHGLFEAVALRTGMGVLAFDIPGTGEYAGPMDSEDGADLVRALAIEARALGNGRVLHLGISMGGHFSACSGLAGDVDAAIVIGGPIEAAFAQGRTFAYGRDGSVGNALGFDHEPNDVQLARIWRPFDLRPLLNLDRNVPMLVINGAGDVHVPQQDTLVFVGRRDTEVHLLSDTGHCAASKMPQVLELMFEWIDRHQSSPVRR